MFSILRLEERSSLSSQRIVQLESKVRDLESQLISKSHCNAMSRDESDGFVVDIFTEPSSNLSSEVSRELSSVKEELNKLQSILLEKERELTEVKVQSATVAVAANLEITKQVRAWAFLEDFEIFDWKYD